jgi:hypothetical protein
MNLALRKSAFLRLVRSRFAFSRLALSRLAFLRSANRKLMPAALAASRLGFYNNAIAFLLAQQYSKRNTEY